MRQLYLSLGIFLSWAGLTAQPEELLEKLQSWETAGQSDSIDLYYPRLAGVYRSEDQLADFLYGYWDWQAYWFENNPKALSILDTALIRQWRPPGNAAEAEALLWVQINRGYHLAALGKILQSVQAYDKAQQLYTQYHFHFFDAVDYLFLPLGAHYTRLGDNEKARGIYLQAIPVAERHRDEESLAGLYNNLGLTYWNAGQYDRAIEVYQQGLALANVSPLRAGLLHLSLAQSYFDGGKNTAAQQQLIRAEDRLRASEKSETQLDYLSGVRKLQGDLSVQKREYGRADRYFAEALRLARRVYGEQTSRDMGKIYVSQGWSYIRQDRYVEALTSFNEAMESVLPAFRPVSPEDNPRAEQLYEENTLLEALSGKAEAYRRSYHREKEKKLLSAALTCYELAYQVEVKLRSSYQYESSKLTLTADSRRRTEKILELTLEQHQDHPDPALIYRALEWMERAKAVVLLDAVQNNVAKKAIQGTDTMFQQEQMLRQQVAYFEGQLVRQPESEQSAEWQREKFQLEQQLEEVIRRLEERYPRLRDFRRQDGRFDRDAFHRILLAHPEDSYVSFFVGEEQIYGLFMGADGARRFARLGTVDSLRREVLPFLGQFNRQANAQHIRQYEQSALEIMRKLLGPLLPARGSGRLCIAPDAWLAFLPFEALVYAAQPGGAATWRELDFLMRHYQVDYIYSAAVALLQVQTGTGVRRSARLVAPLFLGGERRLAPLPGSREELAAIAPSCAEVLVGVEANRDRTLERIQDFRVLHFSTHAKADSAGQGSRIELFDQALYLPDIYALRLNAALVVLSACESGIGHLEEGEGVMSLARAFTYAGGGSLVSSLWSVNAQATTVIMRDFYGQLWNKRPAGDALHRAKLNYLESEAVPGLYKSPYYWAGFVYVGPPEMIVGTGCRPSSILLLTVVVFFLLAVAGFWIVHRRMRK